ncbi:uncharacterized protein LOC129802363 [Phlebotomus papatasi]|uniref:uncharacterized protein LOC129802363 n=1 Tax=Phlebotomus papatasi TaxID=29031 RepID=UPI0024841EC3|nr:uncharacterized protein LOC129802363 [Phlebotomus papatasi]
MGPKSPQKCKDAGMEYINRAGKLVPAKKMRESCGTTCRRSCKMFSEDDRITNFQRFWNLSEAEKKIFISKSVKRFQAKRKIEGPSRRTFTYLYYLDRNNITQQVCKKFFLNTLNISSTKVYYYFENTQTPEGVPDNVKRRRNRGPNYLETDLACVREHIASFPCIESHYCRADSSKKYLESHLNVSKMYRLFRQKYPDSKITEKVYRNVFQFNFNLSFHKPKKDMCPTCNLSQLGRISAEDSQKHLSNNAQAKEERNRDRKIDPQTAVISFDLQNTIPLPKSFVSTFYYKRKFNVYNLTGRCNLNGVTYCSIWNEAVSGRTGDDLASALYKIIQGVLQDHPDVNKIILWSDSCIPQNRNRIMSTTLLQVLHDNPKLQSIEQKFSEPGHSRIQEVDAVHSVLERSLKHHEIPSPTKLLHLMRTLNFPNVKLKIFEMEENDFLQFSLKATLFSWDKVPFSKVRRIKYSSDALSAFKLNFIVDASNNWHEAVIRKRKRNSSTPPDVFTQQIKKMKFSYEVPKEKKNDISSILHFLSEEDSKYYVQKLKIDKTLKIVNNQE